MTSEVSIDGERIGQLERLVLHLSDKILQLELNQNLNYQSALSIQSAATTGNSTTSSNVTTGSQFDSGNTAWVLTASVLVLFMTMPGLSLYYAGMAKKCNIIATIKQACTITCIITVSWLCYGYSISFGPVMNSFPNKYHIYGSADRLWLIGMSDTTYHQLAPTIPEATYCMFQLGFAIIAAALISGSFADRIRFGPMILFIMIWHPLVYCPIAHSIWHPDGFLNEAGVLDFAGGNVVHISAGISSAMSSLVLHHRYGYNPNERDEPQNTLITFMGTCMLWIGWFGFNAGSAGAANSEAAYVMLMTQIAAATAGLSWMSTAWIVEGEPTVLSLMAGAVAGLVVITPMSGYVDQTGAFIAGVLAGPVCYFGAQFKKRLGYEDALDSFGVHAIGGVLGGILTGFFANPNYCDAAGVFYGSFAVGGYQLAMQLYAIVFTILWAGIGSFVLLLGLDYFIGLRVVDEDAGHLDHRATFLEAEEPAVVEKDIDLYHSSSSLDMTVV